MTTKDDDTSSESCIYEKEEKENEPEKTQISYLLSEPFVLSACRVGGQNIKLNSDALTLVQFHATKKLKEIIQNCRTEMCIYKQNTLSFDLLNNILENYTSIKIYGNSLVSHSTNILNSSQVSKNINVMRMTLKCDPLVIPELSPILKGVRYEIQENLKNSENTPDKEYYFLLAKVILHPEKKLWKIAHKEIRDNPRIHSVASHLLNLVHNAIQYPREPGVTETLVETVDALVDNKHLDLSYRSSTTNAIDALISIVLEEDNKVEDYVIKVRASRTLARLLLKWNVEEKTKEKLKNTLEELVVRPEELPISVNYGIIVLCTLLGSHFMDSYLWPNIERFLTLVLRPAEESMKIADNENINEYGHLKGVFLNACSVFYRNFDQQREIDVKTDKILSDYFGDDIEKIKLRVGVSQELKNKGSTVA